MHDAHPRLFPNIPEFHAAVEKRAVAMAEFGRVAGGHPPLTEHMQTWLMIGITAGLTCAVEELYARGLLDGVE